MATTCPSNKKLVMVILCLVTEQTTSHPWANKELSTCYWCGIPMTKRATEWLIAVLINAESIPSFMLEILRDSYFVEGGEPAGKWNDFDWKHKQTVISHLFFHIVLLIALKSISWIWIWTITSRNKKKRECHHSICIVFQNKGKLRNFLLFSAWIPLSKSSN